MISDDFCISKIHLWSKKMPRIKAKPKRFKYVDKLKRRWTSEYLSSAKLRLHYTTTKHSNSALSNEEKSRQSDKHNVVAHSQRLDDNVAIGSRYWQPAIGGRYATGTIEADPLWSTKADEDAPVATRPPERIAAQEAEMSVATSISISTPVGTSKSNILDSIVAPNLSKKEIQRMASCFVVSYDCAKLGTAKFGNVNRKL